MASSDDEEFLIKKLSPSNTSIALLKMPEFVLRLSGSRYRRRRKQITSSCNDAEHLSKIHNNRPVLISKRKFKSDFNLNENNENFDENLINSTKLKNDKTPIVGNNGIGILTKLQNELNCF